jgi:hypothetical protein
LVYVSERDPVRDRGQRCGMHLEPIAENHDDVRAQCRQQPPESRSPGSHRDGNRLRVVRREKHVDAPGEFDSVSGDELGRSAMAGGEVHSGCHQL